MSGRPEGATSGAASPDVVLRIGDSSRRDLRHRDPRAAADRSGPLQLADHRWPCAIRTRQGRP